MDYYNYKSVERCRDIGFNGKIKIDFASFLGLDHSKTLAHATQAGTFYWKPGFSFAQTKHFRKFSDFYEN